MRLIDADAFEKSVMFGDAEDMQDVIYALRDYPTAYDQKKVVEQLEEHFNATNDKGARLAYHHAIQIVKGGVVDG